MRGVQQWLAGLGPSQQGAWFDLRWCGNGAATMVAVGGAGGFVFVVRPHRSECNMECKCKCVVGPTYVGLSGSPVLV